MNNNQTPRDSPILEKKAQLKRKEGSIQYGATSDTATLLEPAKSGARSVCTKLRDVLLTMTIEPVVFCVMFSFVMNSAILTNLMMNVGCKMNLNYSSEVCANLSDHAAEKRQVELLATDYSLYYSLLSLVGAFMMVFIAPWSDRYGRKPPLLCAIAGSIASDVIFILCCVYRSRLEYLLLAKLPSEAFGGFICMLTVIYSHASEVTTRENRTIKYTLVELAMGFGVSLGMLTGGFLQQYYGYLYVYVTVCCLHVLCFLWVLLVVEETTGLGSVAGWREKAGNFFVCHSFKNSIEATFRAREGSKRLLIILLLLSMGLVILMYESFGSIGFVFVHDHYNWTISTYTLLTTIVSMTQMVVTIVMVPIFIHIFKMEDFTLGIIGSLSLVAKNIFIAYAPHQKILFYVGQAAGMLLQLSTLAVRSVLSKTVEKEDLGKVFSFLATCEAVIPMAGNIAVTKLFEATMDSYPNAAYATTAFLLLLPLGTFLWGSWNSKRVFIPPASEEDHFHEKV